MFHPTSLGSPASPSLRDPPESHEAAEPRGSHTREISEEDEEDEDGFDFGFIPTEPRGRHPGAPVSAPPAPGGNDGADSGADELDEEQRAHGERLRVSYAAFQRNQRRFVDAEVEDVPAAEAEAEEDEEAKAQPAGGGGEGGADGEQGGEEEEEVDERIPLLLMPNGTDCLHPDGPPRIDDDNEDEVKDLDEYGQPCDAKFCPVCVFNFRNKDFKVMTDLFKRLSEYGQWDMTQYAKGISIFYHEKIRYHCFTRPEDQKPWHWKSVLNHVRNHDRQTSVHMKDQLTVLRRVIEVASCNMTSVSKRTADQLRRTCTTTGELNRSLILAACVERGSVKVYKDLIDTYNKLEVQLQKCRTQEMENIELQRSRLQTMNQSTRKTRKRRRGGEDDEDNQQSRVKLHRDTVTDFIHTDL